VCVCVEGKKKKKTNAQVFTVSREKYLLDRNFMNESSCSYI